jgi:Cofilin/tropomyosin-type actin-binding protein
MNESKWNMVTEVSDEAQQLFAAMHKGNSIRFMVLGFDEERTQIEVKSVGHYANNNDDDADNAPTHKDFVDLLPGDDVAYAIVNVRYAMHDGGKRDRLFFVCWVPDSLRRDTLRATAQAKAIGVMNASVLKRTFKVGMTATVQANDRDDVALQTLLERAQRREMCSIDITKSLNMAA